jgi:repressor LexA
MTRGSRSRGEQTRDSIKTFIRAFRTDHGFPPTLAEIAQGVGLSSPTSVRVHVLVLAARGELAWQQGKRRTIRTIEPPSSR